MLVKNWKEVWKSLAVWFPAIVTAIYSFLEYSTSNDIIPVQFLPVAVVVSSILGWIIKQNSIRKGGY